MSTSEKKRPSLTEHFDDQIIDNNQDFKSNDDIPIEKVLIILITNDHIIHCPLDSYGQ